MTASVCGVDSVGAQISVHCHFLLVRMLFDHFYDCLLFLLERRCWRSDEAEVSLDFLDVPLFVELFALHQPVHDVVSLPSRFDFLDPLDRFDGVLPQLPVVFNGHVSPLFEFERWVDSQLFASSLAESLGPSGLPWVALLLEKLVTFRSAEPENLAIISHKLNAVPRIYGR